MKHLSLSILIATVVVALAAGKARAVDVMYEINFEITDTTETGGLLGSIFRIDFTVDYDEVDIDSTVQFVPAGSSIATRANGRFADNITSAALTLVTGPYNPSGGTISGGEVRTVDSTVPLEPSAKIEFDFDVSGFPEIAPGRQLESLKIFASDKFDPGLSLNDTGSGQTLLAVIGTTVDLSNQTDNAMSVLLDFGGSISHGQIVSAPISIIPEPGSLALIVMGALTLFLRQRFF
jgi:hypothetical protein